MPDPRTPTAWPPPAPGRGDVARWHALYAGTQQGTLPRKAGATDSELLKRVRTGLATDLCRVHRDMIFGRSPGLLVSPDDARLGETEAEQAQARAVTVMEDGGGWAKLGEAEEIRAWAGGVWLRAGWDTAASDEPFLEAVSPLRASGEFRHGRAVAVTFTTVVRTTGAQVWRWLERHEKAPAAPGQAPVWMVLHGLYAGTPEHLGRRVSLADHPTTAGLPDQVVSPGGARLFWYVKGSPNRGTEGSPEGEAVFAPAEDLLASLDMQARSLATEFLLGQRQIVVPVEALSGGQTPADFLARRVFTPLDFGVTGSGEAAGAVTPIDFDLRVTQHLDGMRETTEMAASRSGIAPQSLGLEIEGTAESGTALRQRVAKTLSTAQGSRRSWQPVVTEAVETLLTLDREVWKRPTVPVRPGLSWPELTEESLADRGAWLQALSVSGAASIETLVREAQADAGWTDEQVQEEVDRIREEKAGPPVADLGGLFPAAPADPAESDAAA